MDRRTFVKAMAGAAGALAAGGEAAAQLRTARELPTRTLQTDPALTPKAATAVSPAPAPAPAPSATTTGSSAAGPKAGYLTGPTALVLDGAFAGYVTEVEGGDARGEVVTERAGADQVVRKHVGSVRYSDLRMDLGGLPEGAVLKWISAMLDRKPIAMSGAVVSLDLNGSKAVQRELTHAQLAEVRLPELDASSSVPAFITLVLAAEQTRWRAGDPSKLPAAKSSAKKIVAANFRVRIPGLESACERVSKIEALTFKQKRSEGSAGETRVAERAPGALELSDLVLSVAETHAQPFYDWHEESVIKGNPSEKTATIELLSPTLKDVLLTVTLHGCGIYEVVSAKAPRISTAVRTARVAMYCERATLK